jgi:hypothetical protein
MLLPAAVARKNDSSDGHSGLSLSANLGLHGDIVPKSKPNPQRLLT